MFTPRPIVRGGSASVGSGDHHGAGSLRGIDELVDTRFGHSAPAQEALTTPGMGCPVAEYPAEPARRDEHQSEAVVEDE